SQIFRSIPASRIHVLEMRVDLEIALLAFHLGIPSRPRHEGGTAKIHFCRAAAVAIIDGFGRARYYLDSVDRHFVHALDLAVLDGRDSYLCRGRRDPQSKRCL